MSISCVNPEGRIRVSFFIFVSAVPGTEQELNVYQSLVAMLVGVVWEAG